MTNCFQNEQDLIHFFDFCTQPHLHWRYWIRSLLLQLNGGKNNDAGVLVGFHFNPDLNDYEIILTQRSAELKQHSNQISFPGGKREPIDNSIIDTAKRETEEEIGIHPDSIRIYGVLQKIKSPSRYNVYPVLAILDKYPDQKNKNSAEVTEVFALPCQLLLNPKHYLFKSYYRYFPFNIIALNYPDKHLWGLTAEILYFMAKIYGKYQKR